MSVRSSASRTKKDRTRPSGRGSKATPPAPATSAFRAAETSEERTGSAFRAVGGGLSAMARGVGGLTRRAPKEDRVTQSTEPEETTSEPRDVNMDGVALTLIGLAAVLGASVWMDIAGPVGAAISTAAHLAIGAGALILPVALVALAVALMLGVRHAPADRTRIAVGTTLIAVSMLGLVHLLAGNPAEWDGRVIAGGAIGAWTGGTLALGFSSYVAIPLLILVIVYGALKVTGITTRQAFDYVRDLINDIRTPGPEHDDIDGDGDDLYGHVDDDIDALAEGRERAPRPAPRPRPRPTPRTTRASRSSTPLDNYPVEEDPAEEFEHDTQHTLFDTPVARDDTDEFPAVDAVAA